jgi:transcription-repair coupling factor (superfamily II helicase)
LSEVAQKRLQTIFEATELGAGFQIALRDLEIRGAGNLLGGEQSGQIGTVGFDLYVKLLADAVEGLKALARGEPPPPPKMQAPIVIDLPITAFIPESYVGDLNLRLALYQRMASDADVARRRPTDDAGEAESVQPDPAEEMERELADRFGQLPTPVRNLLYVLHLRTLARRAGIQSIAREDGPGGRAIISIRSGDSGDFRMKLLPSAMRAFERGGVVTVGHSQLRIDLEAAGEGWRAVVEEVLGRLMTPK